MSVRRLAFSVLLPALLLVSGCGEPQSGGPVRVDVSGAPDDLRRPLEAARRPAGQLMLAATAQGLLTFDARGEILPAMAESWIVADDGRSIIFRLRRLDWLDGRPVKAPEVAALLRQRMRASPRLLAGLSPQVRAMTDRVIEVRLSGAFPSFLQLLAQPAMAIQPGTAPGGTGPYRPKRQGPGWLLEPLPDPLLGPDGEEGEIPRSAYRAVQAVGAPLGIVRFASGQSDMLLGGRFQDLPLLAVGKLGGDRVRADPVQGLFGFAVEARSGPLVDRTIRSAVAAAIDREQLARDLGVAGWTISYTILPGALDLGRAPTLPDWSLAPLAQRRAVGREAVTRWQVAEGVPPPLRIALPAGSGARLLFFRIAADLRAIGLTARMVAWEAPADLRLIDEVPPFDSALWYLARLDCARGIFCDPQASRALDEARNAGSPADLSIALGEAETRMAGHGGYIALGSPIRWSLVSPQLTGFAASPRARHPLNRLVADPR